MFIQICPKNKKRLCGIRKLRNHKKKNKFEGYYSTKQRSATVVVGCTVGSIGQIQIIAYNLCATRHDLFKQMHVISLKGFTCLLPSSWFLLTPHDECHDLTQQ